MTTKNRRDSPDRLRLRKFDPRLRAVIDGWPRGHLRRAGLSRARFRELAHRGEFPGILKSSWRSRLPLHGPPEGLRRDAADADIPGGGRILSSTPPR